MDGGGGAQIGGGVASLIHEKVRSKMKILTIFEEPTKIIEKERNRRVHSYFDLRFL